MTHKTHISQMTGSDEIFIERMAVETIIGVHDFEQHVPQTLWLSLSMGLDLSAAVAADALHRGLDYGTVAKRIRSYMTGHRHQLIETLAAALCELLLAEFPILERVSLRIEKPDALAGCESLGVRIERQRAR